MRMWKRAGLTAVGVALMVGVAAGAGSALVRADGATMKISPSSQNVASSASSFKVDVTLEAGSGVGAFDFTVSYDKDLLELQSVEEGPFLATSGTVPSCYRGPADIFPAGLVNFGCGIIGSAPVGANGAGVLASITFKPKATGTSPLVYITYGLAAPNGDSLGTNAADGIVKIVMPGDEDKEPLAATPTVNAGARTPTGRPPLDRDPFVRDGSSAATPVPGGSSSSGTPGQSGTLRPGQSGTLSGQTSGVSGNNSGTNATGPNGAPVAGTGYRAEERSPWWPALYAVLALGAGALLGGVTVRRSRRMR